MPQKPKILKTLIISAAIVVSVFVAIGLYLSSSSTFSSSIGEMAESHDFSGQDLNADLLEKTEIEKTETNFTDSIESESNLISQSLSLVKNKSTATTSSSSNQCAWPNAWLAPKSGNDLSVVINKNYCLPSSYAPTDLVDVGITGVHKTKSSMLVRQTIVTDMTAMVSSMHAAGLNISVFSCYRSYAVQQSVYNYWVSTLGQTQADRVSARPGHSEHQLGTVCDFSTSEISHSMSTSFANTAAGKWMKSNAANYGFKMSYPEGQESITGYSWEPWHWRYVGK